MGKIYRGHGWRKAEIGEYKNGDVYLGNWLEMPPKSVSGRTLLYTSGPDGIVLRLENIVKALFIGEKVGQKNKLESMKVD